MPVIRVSEATWHRMKQHAQPLEDSPNDVIVRALDALDIITSNGTRTQTSLNSTSKNTRSTKTKRATMKIDHQEFRLPILETLRELGGRAQPKSVRERIAPKLFGLFGARFNEAELAPLSNGQPRWWNAACWERKYLVNDGLLKSESNRGVWELDERGYKFLEQA